MKKLNLLGKTFGRWTVIAEAPIHIDKNGKSARTWHVKCECGVHKIIRTSNLTGHRSTSCGCRIGDWSRNHTGDKSPTWKGGIVYDDFGYKLIRNTTHHRAKANGYVREHIVVMENMLGRKLLPHEQVHHINGIKDDNRKENLELWSKSQPSGQRVTDKLKWAKEILKLYGKEKIEPH